MRRLIFAALLGGVLLVASKPGGAAPPSGGTDAPASSPGWMGAVLESKESSGGVRVARVIRTSPAEKAGLREGDRILRIDAAKVSSAAEVVQILSRRGAGSVVALAVARGEAERVVSVTLAARPTMEDIARMEHVGTFAPAWGSLTPVAGQVPASIQALRGKVALVEFWATWCGPCRLTAPTLSAWQAKYGAQGLKVVGITSDVPAVAALHAQRSGMGFASAADESGDATKAYGVSSLPTLFVIDKRGVVRDVLVGYQPGQEARTERLVQQLLAEPAPSDGP
jgi:thiol-disulfide isomerase/thioredoxin